jgi:hypothetical protein
MIHTKGSGWRKSRNVQKKEKQMDKGVTGGCINCARCERVRTSFFCGRSRLTMKQVYNTKGYCSKFKPKEGKKDGQVH